MFYKKGKKDFKHHVHPSLQKRVRIFFIIGGVMLALMAWDVYQGSLSLELAAISVVLGAVAGLITSRIFSLSWSEGGNQVVGRIDALGWVVLAVYIAFEIGRSIFFQEWVPASATAVTFAFVASALIARVFGLRGRILKILKDEKVFG